MMADGGNNASAEMTIVRQVPETKILEIPSASMERFEESPHPFYYWERHLLRLRLGSRSIGLAMGLRKRNAVHWWEACGMTVLQKSPEFSVIEMAGSVPHRVMSPEEFQSHPGYGNPYLHRHNWLSGHIHARLHANGVCEIFARHINSKFVDDGADLDDAVPVIGFDVKEADPAVSLYNGPWTGEHKELEIDGVRMDVSEISRFARPEQPGVMENIGRFLVWQPYAGVELYGGICPDELTGDPFIFRAEQKVIPRGMARTLRFSLSLSDRSPKVARYLAPAWWYGVCEELLPESLLPVSNAYDDEVTASRNWIQEHIVHGGFEDGSVPRNLLTPHFVKERIRHEPGWEGEVCYAQFLAAWRSGDESDFLSALRSACYFTDVSVDHAAKLVRMHGFAPHAFSLTMSRIQGTFAAYLETGDPYFLDTARAVTVNAHWLNKNSWPRMAVGRDAYYVRSAALIYRYTGESFFRDIAHEGALAAAATQRTNGSFGDQGGGCGLHQWGGYISKPWIGLLATSGMLDYLELFPDENPLLQSVKRFADWLMEERCEWNSFRVWGYQHDYKGGRNFFDPYSGKPVSLPSGMSWHHHSLARLLAFCSWKFDDPAYLEAWAESHQARNPDNDDQSCSATLQYLPWIQTKMWNAKLTDDGISIHPKSFGRFMPTDAVVLGPNGPLPIRTNNRMEAITPSS
ncbi:MAG TPA: hypothetical protein PLS03_11585 [Terrimicrobiaceae bacterium]|nr:hypothetical protein [Terrimicrobiaceae bacterium]